MKLHKTHQVQLMAALLNDAVRLAAAMSGAQRDELQVDLVESAECIEVGWRGIQYSLGWPEVTHSSASYYTHARAVVEFANPPRELIELPDVTKAATGCVQVHFLTQGGRPQTLSATLNYVARTYPIDSLVEQIGQMLGTFLMGGRLTKEHLKNWTISGDALQE